MTIILKIWLEAKNVKLWPLLKPIENFFFIFPFKILLILRLWTWNRQDHFAFCLTWFLILWMPSQCSDNCWVALQQRKMTRRCLSVAAASLVDSRKEYKLHELTSIHSREVRWRKMWWYGHTELLGLKNRVQKSGFDQERAIQGPLQGRSVPTNDLWDGT